jgi:penicillin-binding protein 1A
MPAPARPSTTFSPGPAPRSTPGQGRNWLARLGIVALLGTALLVGGGALGWVWLDETLPDVFSFDAYRQIARESSRVHAAGGEVVAQFGDEIRTVVPYERIPKSMLYALVCAEDAAFYSHPGLDFAGIARALWIDVTQGRYAQGASTITQQFAKTRYLDRGKTFTRKLKELVLARKLETRLSKDEILTLYANEVYFGHGRYGVEEAARFYFGRSVSEIDVAQAAMLAGIVNSPAKFSPLRHPDNAKGRRTYVLEQMHKHGYITAEDFQRADATPLPQKGHDDLAPVGPYYVEAVRRFVLTKVEREQLLYGGLRIEVALDSTMQRAAEAAVAAGLARIDKQYKVAQPVKHYGSEAELQEGLRKLANTQGHGKPSLGRVVLGVVRGFDEGKKAWTLDLGGVQGLLAVASLGRYLDKDGQAPTFQTGDLLRISVREKQETGLVLSPEFGPQVALVALEPGSRLVRAVVGGDDFTQHPFDRVLQAKRQPGSTFKTFTYGAAIEAGQITPDSELKDESRTFIVAGRPWTPRNFSGRYDGRTYSMRDALAFSINSIAVAVAAQVGPEHIAAFARKLGIDSELQIGLPLALGASSVSPLELVNAYATIADSGKLAAPVLVTRIVDRAGKDLFLAERKEGVQVVPEGLTRQLTDMLGEVVRKGSGKEAGKIGRMVAGKTGTSNGSRDAWFVGFSADLCAAVWVGYDDRKPIAKGTGGVLAVPIWAEFMQKALDRVPPTPLPRLPHVLAGPVENLPPLPAGDPEAAAPVEDDVLDEPTKAQPPPELPPLPKKRAEPEEEAL